MIHELQPGGEKFPASLSIDQVLESYEQTFFNDMYAPEMKVHTKNSYLENLVMHYNSGRLTEIHKEKIIDFLKRAAQNEKEFLAVRETAVRQIKNLNDETAEDALEELFYWHSESETSDNKVNSDNSLVRVCAETALTQWIKAKRYKKSP